MNYTFILCLLTADFVAQLDFIVYLIKVIIDSLILRDIFVKLYAWYDG